MVLSITRSCMSATESAAEHSASANCNRKVGGHIEPAGKRIRAQGARPLRNTRMGYRGVASAFTAGQGHMGARMQLGPDVSRSCQGCGGCEFGYRARRRFLTG